MLLNSGKDVCQQWRRQPDNSVPLCKFKIIIIFISLEIDCFHSQWTRKYLHSGTKSSGWLRYCLSTCLNVNRTLIVRDAGTMWRQGGQSGRFSWKGTFELIYTKRCLQNIGSWTSPNHVFYLLDDRGEGVLRQAIVVFLKLDDCISCVFWSKFVK